MGIKDYIQFGFIFLNLIIIVIIAINQIGISKLNLKLSLYDRRCRIYESTIEFISEYLRNIVSKNDEKMLNLLVDFKTNIQQSIFLFDDTMETYLLQILNTALNIKSDIIRGNDFQKNVEWFELQKVEARVKFKSYMKFKK
jgi:hypothetical protein